ncbi:MAG: hypothetical protein AAF468_13935 [Pseudomonadota bacterium]
MKIGLLPLARATFDVDFANENLRAMLSELDQSGHEFTGSRDLLFDADATNAALSDLASQPIDCVLVLQVTFTDAVAIVDIANTLEAPLSIWAIPEPRLGGRLRLNSFCGLNLASHALGLNGISFGWSYCAPDKMTDAEFSLLLGTSNRAPAPQAVSSSNSASARAQSTAASLAGKRIGRIGAHPDGFDTCAYDTNKLDALAGVAVDELELDDLFETARALPDDAAETVLETAKAQLSGLDAVDQTELDRSARLKVALDELRSGGNYDAFAIRCWPETFTEYGGAVCGPVSMLGEARTPCACEADVYGALTQLVLQQVADAPVFLTDLVDIDVDDNSGVIWHCGQAPISMRDPDVEPAATIHTNRKMPLLFEFPLKPGRVTLMRMSQAKGQTAMVIATGEMLKRPMAFTGTSGVIRFDAPASETLDRVIESRLEHHMAVCYGDHRAALLDVAAALDLPVVEI